MTTIDTRPDAADSAVDGAVGGSALVPFFVGVAAWVTTTDHKRIGRLYASAGLVALLVTAVLGLMLGIERAGDGAVLEPNALLQIFQAYRVGLVFAVVIPLVLPHGSDTV